MRSAREGAKTYLISFLLALHVIVPFALGFFVGISGDLTLDGPSGPGFWLPLAATLLIAFTVTVMETRTLGRTKSAFFGDLSALAVNVFVGVLICWTFLTVFVVGLFTPFVVGWGSLGLDDLCGQYTLEGCDSADEDFAGAIFSWLVGTAYLAFSRE